MAEVEILFHCFYMQMGVKEGHPVLSVRWPLTPMPEPEVGEVYGGLVFNLGSTNTVLVRDEGVNILVARARRGWALALLELSGPQVLS